MTDLDVTLRPAAATDRDLLYRIYAATRTEELAPVPWSDEQKVVFLRQQFEAQDLHYRRHYPSASFQIIEVGKEPAGRLYVDRWASEIRLMDIALLPEFRNRGVGSRLLHELLAEARASGRAVSIHVERNNPALRLYERLGFRPEGEHGIYLLMRWTSGGGK